MRVLFSLQWAFATYFIKHVPVLLFVLAMPWIATAQLETRASLETELNRLRNSLKSDLSDSVYVNTINELGVEIRYQNSDSLHMLSQQALVHSQKIGYNKGILHAHIGLGNYFSDQGLHKKGINHYQLAMREAALINDLALQLQIQNKLAGEYEYRGDFDLALEALLQGIETAKKINDLRMLSILNENIGLLYATQNENEEAIRYLEIAKKYNEEIKDDLFYASTFANMASTFAELKNYDYAMFYVNKSIAIFEKQGNIDWLAFAYGTKGKTYLRQKNYKWALFWFNQGELLHQKNLEDQRARIHILQGLSETYFGLGRDDKAQEYAQLAFESASKLNVIRGKKNASQTLYELNKKEDNAVKALQYHEIFQQLSDTLARNENKKNLLMLQTRLSMERQKEKLIAENELALAEQKNYVTAIMGVLLIFMAITFLVKRSEKIQKNLNKELSSKKALLEKNEAELLAINHTKDKLFSIIGHDLRGPIGSFQGLIHLFLKGDITQKEFLAFIPKLNGDIDHISFTLNNLLSWGQTQIKGSVTKPSEVNIYGVVEENINLLSAIARKKFIHLEQDVNQKLYAWADNDQINIVVRNLISNALKFTPEHGLVTINAKETYDCIEINVNDTGVGIDEQTKAKLFSKNENVTTYGTHNEKGTGLGLMLCKEMIENNHGKIWVESTPGQGTRFYFTLPLLKNEAPKTVKSNLEGNLPLQNVLH